MFRNAIPIEGKTRKQRPSSEASRAAWRLSCTVSFTAILFVSLAAAEEPGNDPEYRRPNIIVIIADDMGYADAGFTGAKDIKTPNLDELAASGVIFEQGYVNHPFCGPSRAALLSGRYQHRFGFETNPAYDPANPILGIDPEEILFPARLQKAGYATGCIGKWHLGAAEAFHPNVRGFDYFYGFLGGGHDYFQIDLTKRVNEGYLQALVRNNKPAIFDGYLTTALSQDAASFVSINKDKPFFLYVAYNAPHGPLQAPEEDIARYSHIKDPKRRMYAAMVDVMDRGIGEIVQSLEKNGLRHNTLIFFLSDNGGPQTSEKRPGNWNGSSNVPFREGKGSLYEGGVHVPFIASWPAKIKSGASYESPVIALDIARTAVEVARADANTGKGMEGVNLIPFVNGEVDGVPHEHLFWRGGGGYQWSVLAADGYKQLANTGSTPPELFRLTEDASESQNLMSTHADKGQELRAVWTQWNKLNIPGQFFDYTKYHEYRDKFYLEAIPDSAD